ncbi:MAG: hypothetical protein J1F27_02930, partial [Prevotellaceae bacterium]|nr:hypothetical protein [Prevotellaceae bacterium]
SCLEANRVLKLLCCLRASATAPLEVFSSCTKKIVSHNWAAGFFLRAAMQRYDNILEIASKQKNFFPVFLVPLLFAPRSWASACDFVTLLHCYMLQ